MLSSIMIDLISMLLSNLYGRTEKEWQLIISSVAFQSAEWAAFIPWKLCPLNTVVHPHISQHLFIAQVGLSGHLMHRDRRSRTGLLPSSLVCL